MTQLPEALDGRRGRGGALTAHDQRLAALGAPQHDRQVAARPVQVRLDDLEREAGRDRGVEGVAPSLEHRHPRGGGEPVGRGDHPEGAPQLGSGREAQRSGAPASSGDGSTMRGASAPRRTRWHATRCPFPVTSTSGGSSSVERGADSCSSGQRVRKRHPEGGSIGLGMSPSSTTRRPGALDLRVRLERRGEQGLRVRVLRSREQLLARRDLDDLAEVHHRDAVAQELDRGEVVADEEARESEVGPQVAHQVEHGGLHRDVQGRDRLVRDQQARVDAERPGQADALPLAAGELVRVAEPQLRPEPDGVEELDDAPVDLGAPGQPVEADRLPDDLCSRSCVG